MSGLAEEALRTLNGGGSLGSGGSTVINISAVDTQSFAQAIAKNKALVEKIIIDGINSNSGIRGSVRRA